MSRKGKPAGEIEQPAEPDQPVEPDLPEDEEEDSSVEQSGDLQGLSGLEDVDSESARELAEEGQFYEAEVVDAIENAPPADAGPLRPRRRREDDLPPEYADLPPDEPIE